MRLFSHGRKGPDTIFPKRIQIKVLQKVVSALLSPTLGRCGGSGRAHRHALERGHGFCATARSESMGWWDGADVRDYLLRRARAETVAKLYRRCRCEPMMASGSCMGCL